MNNPKDKAKKDKPASAKISLRDLPAGKEAGKVQGGVATYGPES